jgi:hypothetical protein
MPTMVSAVETTANTSASVQVRNVAKTLAYLDPEAAPFTLVTMEGDKRVADNFKFEWPEKANRPLADQDNGGNTTSTTFNVDHGDYFRVGDLVKNVHTGEVMRVTAISTTPDRRAWGRFDLHRILDGQRRRSSSARHTPKAAVGTEKTHQRPGPQLHADLSPDLSSTRPSRTPEPLGTNRPGSARWRRSTIHIEQSFLFSERNTDVSDLGTAALPGGASTTPRTPRGRWTTEAEVWSW